MNVIVTESGKAVLILTFFDTNDEAHYYIFESDLFPSDSEEMIRACATVVKKLKVGVDLGGVYDIDFNLLNNSDGLLGVPFIDFDSLDRMMSESESKLEN
jgi:hypothetical protein